MNKTKCEVELVLDEFAFEEVDRASERLGVPWARVVERAVRHWLDEGPSGRLAALPLPALPRAVARPAVALAVDLPPSDWEAVKHEAQALEIEPAGLIEHAVLLLLADADSGGTAAKPRCRSAQPGPRRARAARPAGFRGRGGEGRG